MNHDSRDDSRDYQRGLDVGSEGAVSDSVDVLAAALVRIAAPIWRWGDGSGGHVFRVIGDAAARIGLAMPTDVQPGSRSYVVRLAERDGWNCAYCDTPLGWGHPLVTPPQVDHVIPKCQGGSNGIDNLVLSCGPCNRDKSGRTPEQWRAAGEMVF